MVGAGFLQIRLIGGQAPVHESRNNDVLESAAVSSRASDIVRALSSIYVAANYSQCTR